MINTGLCGFTQYFWRGNEPGWYEKWGVSIYEDYLERAIEKFACTRKSNPKSN
ncbi:hypothetical protein H8E77_11570 [bacterium]|nr:hypothetical protein [bacterium]